MLSHCELGRSLPMQPRPGHVQCSSSRFLFQRCQATKQRNHKEARASTRSKAGLQKRMRVELELRTYLYLRTYPKISTYELHLSEMFLPFSFFSLFLFLFSPSSFFSRRRFENKLRKTKHGQMLGCEPSFENVLCLEIKY